MSVVSLDKPALRSVHGETNPLHRIHQTTSQRLCHYFAQYVTSSSSSCVFYLRGFCVLLFIATAKMHVPVCGQGSVNPSEAELWGTAAAFLAVSQQRRCTREHHLEKELLLFSVFILVAAALFCPRRETISRFGPRLLQEVPPEARAIDIDFAACSDESGLWRRWRLKLLLCDISTVCATDPRVKIRCTRQRFRGTTN